MFHFSQLWRDYTKQLDRVHVTSFRLYKQLAEIEAAARHDTTLFAQIVEQGFMECEAVTDLLKAEEMAALGEKRQLLADAHQQVMSKHSTSLVEPAHVRCTTRGVGRSFRLP